MKPYSEINKKRQPKISIEDTSGRAHNNPRPSEDKTMFSRSSKQSKLDIRNAKRKQNKRARQALKNNLNQE